MSEGQKVPVWLPAGAVLYESSQPRKASAGDGGTPAGTGWTGVCEARFPRPADRMKKILVADDNGRAGIRGHPARTVGAGANVGARVTPLQRTENDLGHSASVTYMSPEQGEDLLPKGRQWTLTHYKRAPLSE